MIDFITDENGFVTYLYKTSTTTVKGKMTKAGAMEIIDKSYNITKSDNPDFPICVDDKWFFSAAPDFDPKWIIPPDGIDVFADKPEVLAICKPPKDDTPPKDTKRTGGKIKLAPADDSPKTITDEG